MSKILMRYLEPYIKDDFKTKMVFLGGPIQVGKTTLVQSLIKNYRDDHPAYLNWEDVKDLDKIYALAEELPNRVGSPLSLKSLSNAIEVDFKTIKRWLGILSSLYYSFQISPFGAKKIRAVKKEQKLYMWDWSQIESPGIRFENMVASHLLKYCHFLEDTEGYKTELRFLRDTDKREIDFVVMKDSKPLFAVECKHGEKSISPHIFYFRERTPIPRFFQIHLGKAHKQVDDQIFMMPFLNFCKEVRLV